MSNPWAGEVTLVIEGTPRVMKLTLGALAELEHSLAVGSLVYLVQRFESGGFSAGDVLALIAAGLQGGGHAMTPSDLAKAEIEGGVLMAARAAAQLLARAFMTPEET
ncbi:gene transfer agent family protein [Parasedimentitalea maritima]|uniref:Gene transfer agent family protein n=1 Tax=Parasedimentitalea maritima TaxID=2578117 RepID=A0ABY2UPN6_9RHOB|nr:gene transfer agent family protein [Zongyanglinia marina]TLP56507.1 gene transfer agent family protein [Zongyanglinia marina]